MHQVVRVERPASDEREAVASLAAVVDTLAGKARTRRPESDAWRELDPVSARRCAPAAFARTSARTPVEPDTVPRDVGGEGGRTLVARTLQLGSCPELRPDLPATLEEERPRRVDERPRSGRPRPARR